MCEIQEYVNISMTWLLDGIPLFRIPNPILVGFNPNTDFPLHGITLHQGLMTYPIHWISLTKNLRLKSLIS